MDLPVIPGRYGISKERVMKSHSKRQEEQRVKNSRSDINHKQHMHKASQTDITGTGNWINSLWSNDSMWQHRSGLLPDCAKPSPEPILTNNQRGLVAFIWGQFIGNNEDVYPWYEFENDYRQVSNISRTLVGNKIVDHSDEVGASPVGAAPTTSSFST